MKNTKKVNYSPNYFYNEKTVATNQQKSPKVPFILDKMIRCLKLQKSATNLLSKGQNQLTVEEELKNPDGYYVTQKMRGP